MTRNIRWWNRLGVKLAVPIALLTLGTIGISAALALRSQARHIRDEVVRGGAQLSETIKSSIYHHMLEDRREEAYLVMEAIGRQTGIEGVRTVNAAGITTFSTDPAERNRPVDRVAQGCAQCHPSEVSFQPCEAASTERIYQGPKGSRVLGVITPVYNEPSCSAAACHAHPESQRVLGVIDVGLSLAWMDESLQTLKRDTLFVSAAAIVLLSAMVILLTRKQVVRPVRDLLQGTRWVSSSALEHRIPVRSQDELGLLSKSFNEMTESLRSSRAELQELMESLERQVEERTQALRQAQEQLAQSEKLSSLGKLSASIAHEINNPLMGILTIAKLLIRTLEAASPAERDPSRETQLRQLRMVQRETERCSAIVRNLLDFARQKPLALKELDVRLAIEEVLSVSANQMAIQGIRVVKDLPAVPPVRADLGQVRQAILNVVLNACDTMPSGGTLTLATRALSSERLVQIEVSDTGTGIAPEHLRKIFDPFFTTKEKGTGLGLSVVYGIVQRHGGTLDVQSQPGQGTHIFINLPMAFEAVAV